MTTLRKKLIESALPLDAINKASAREKPIRHGRPSTWHLWWARQPLAAARGVTFNQEDDEIIRKSSDVSSESSDPNLQPGLDRAGWKRSQRQVYSQRWLCVIHRPFGLIHRSGKSKKSRWMPCTSQARGGTSPRRNSLKIDHGARVNAAIGSLPLKPSLLIIYRFFGPIYRFSIQSPPMVARQPSDRRAYSSTNRNPSHHNRKPAGRQFMGGRIAAGGEIVR